MYDFYSCIVLYYDCYFGKCVVILYVLAERVKTEGIKVACVPTSFQAHQLIVANNLVLGNLELHSEVCVLYCIICLR